MATGKITKRSVEGIAPPVQGKRDHLWDDVLKGFGVMVTDKGVRSSLVQYCIGGRGGTDPARDDRQARFAVNRREGQSAGD